MVYRRLSSPKRSMTIAAGHRNVAFQDENEQGAYLICGLSRTESEARLLVRRVITVRPEHLRAQSRGHLCIESTSFVRAMKSADEIQGCFVFVHSHPSHLPTHSAQDDREEPGLFRTAYNRIKTPNAIHASLVLTRSGPVGRVWLDGGALVPLDLVRIYGRRFAFHFLGGLDHSIETAFHDRQVRAFGRELQPLLKGLTVGVVGADVQAS